MGVEHRHIFGQLNGMLNLGCECVGWWNETDNKIRESFPIKIPKEIIKPSKNRF